MKKVISILLSLLYLLGVPMFAFAEEITTCSISVDSVPTPPGEQITVPVRITENQGFTNFAISLEYDPEKLELISINTTDDQNPYLCGPQVSTNMDWKNAEGKSCGYIVSASENAVSSDGILFTATFRVSQNFDDYTTVTPVVHYVRNNSAVFSIFEGITASVTSGTITAIVAGDVTGDGMVEYDDVMLVYKALTDDSLLTEEQKKLADINGDNVFNETDLNEIYRIYTGG